jgi:uncharacterized protein YecE (DUF72 family)
LTDYLVGTGGWAYFGVPNKPSLKAYSEIFNFVEVNYTFYQYASIQTVERWRRTVPRDFTFSVRCHKDLTHKIGLKPVDEAYETFYRMKMCAEILQTPYLVLETPSRYAVNDDTRDFLSSLNFKGIKLVWEYRAPITQSVTNLMQDFGIIQCVDLSKQKPSYNLEVTYSRLFGKGQQNIYQFTNDEMLEIQSRAEETLSKKVMMSYHGLRMSNDALRFQQHLTTGKFLPATSATGIDSAKSVLAEDAIFPSSKSEIIKAQGWKVIDIKKDKTAHLSEYLNTIPERVYNNTEEVLKELKPVL